MRDNVRNTVIRHQAGMLTVESMIRERRLQWLGHLARMDQSRTPRQLMVFNLEGGKRYPGGQKLRWMW